MKDTLQIKKLKNELTETVLFLHSKMWAPATSSNYSFRIPGQNEFMISQSGVDKGSFSAEHLMKIDIKGKAINDERKPSAETLLHTLLYENKDVNCVLHTHSVNGTVLSMVHEKDEGINLKGFEILKGLRNIDSHEKEIWLPIFFNSQDMEILSEEIRTYMRTKPGIHGFLLAGHGLYTWGSDIKEAKRQVEVFEFIFECLIKLKALNFKL